MGDSNTMMEKNLSSATQEKLVCSSMLPGLPFALTQPTGETFIHGLEKLAIAFLTG